MRSADVANGVATTLGITRQRRERAGLGTVARTDVQAIDVTAISTDPDQAVALADTTARVLIDFVGTDQQSQFAAARDEVLAEARRPHRPARRSSRSRSPTTRATPRSTGPSSTRSSTSTG